VQRQVTDFAITADFAFPPLPCTDAARNRLNHFFAVGGPVIPACPAP
jgi:hypothetical protein